MNEKSRNRLSPEEAYSRAALQMALYQTVADEIPDAESSAADPVLDKRILGAINDRFRRLQMQKITKWMAANTLKTAVLAILILNLCLTTGFAFSRNFRERILRLFVTVEQDHSELGMRETDTVPEEECLNPEGYILSWLPDESYKVTESITQLFSCSITYQSEKGGVIMLDVYSAGTETSVDTEGMEQTVIRMAGKDMQVFRHDGRIVMIWQDSNAYYTIQTLNLSEAEAITAALSVKPDD